MDARPDLLTVKKLTIGIGGLLPIILVIATPAIGAENTPAPPSSGWTFSSIIILLGVVALVGLVLYLMLKKDAAYDWVPPKDRAMFEKLIAAKDKDGIESFLQFISLFGLQEIRRPVEVPRRVVVRRPVVVRRRVVR
jgi:hypothetical protein